MYKLLIVEDERAIAQGMANSIPWENWGFSVIGICSNGVEAVDFIAKNKPDLVLSDIRMPQMDGIALMQYLNENYPEIKIIILSGYNDFNYLQMAIRNRVAEYLLKPTDIDEFEVVFARMKEHLDEEGRRRLEEEEKRQNEKLNALLKGYGYDEDETEEEMYHLEDQYFGLVLFERVNGGSADSQKLYEQKLEDVSILNSTNQNRSNGHIKAWYFVTYQDDVAGVLCLDEDVEEEEIADYLHRLADEVREKTGFSLFCGASSFSQDYRMLPQCYEQAKCCIGQKLFQKEKQGLLFFRQIREADDDYYRITFNEEKILHCILKQDREGVRQEVEETFGMLWNQVVRDHDYVNRMGMEILFVLSRKMLRYQVRPEEIMNEHDHAYADIYKKCTLEEKQEFLIEIFELFMEACNRQQDKNSKTGELAKTIRLIVDEEYMSNLISLEYIADRVHKSPAYISKIFKNEFGYNFSTYIMEKRLRKSKELLRDQAIKIYEISEQLGWADVSSYIKVFKKKYAMSPDEYRKILMKNR